MVSLLLLKAGGTKVGRLPHSSFIKNLNFDRKNFLQRHQEKLLHLMHIKKKLIGCHLLKLLYALNKYYYIPVHHIIKRIFPMDNSILEQYVKIRLLLMFIYKLIYYFRELRFRQKYSRKTFKINTWWYT